MMKALALVLVVSVSFTSVAWSEERFAGSPNDAAEPAATPDAKAELTEIIKHQRAVSAMKSELEGAKPQCSGANAGAYVAAQASLIYLNRAAWRRFRFTESLGYLVGNLVLFGTNIAVAKEWGSRAVIPCLKVSALLEEVNRTSQALSAYRLVLESQLRNQ